MADAGERSIASVLGDIAGNIQELVRSEIRLGKAEAASAAGHAAKGVTLVTAGGGVSLLAVALLSLAGVYLFATVVAMWIAALIVAAVVAAVGGVLIAAGLKQMRQVTFALPRTAATIKENLEWPKPSIR